MTEYTLTRSTAVNISIVYRDVSIRAHARLALHLTMSLEFATTPTRSADAPFKVSETGEREMG